LENEGYVEEREKPGFRHGFMIIDGAVDGVEFVYTKRYILEWFEVHLG